MTTSLVHNRKLVYTILPEVFERLPDAKVAVGIIQIFVEKAPKDKEVQNFLSARKQACVSNFIERYPTTSEYSNSKVLNSWRSVFSTFHVAEDKRCTLENLFQRVCREADKIVAAKNEQKKVPKADLGKISNIVDLVNCISIDNEVPIGVMDASLLRERLTLRNGKLGETFKPLGDPNRYDVHPDHLVLADAEKVISWLWTCKVGENVIVQEQAEGDAPATVLICVDQAEASAGDAEKALDQLLAEVSKIKGVGRKIGVLSKDNNELAIHF